MDKRFIKQLDHICGDDSEDKEKRIASKEFLDVIYNSNRIQKRLKNLQNTIELNKKMRLNETRNPNYMKPSWFKSRRNT